jgi:two-component system, NtrC family, response regulator AtoC
MQQYTWPGNIRELRNVIERVVLLARGGSGEIRAQDLPLAAAPSASRAAVGSTTTLEELERQHIEAVLTQTRWHQGKAAKILGISSKTLYRKIREYGMHRPGRLPVERAGVHAGELLAEPPFKATEHAS